MPDIFLSYSREDAAIARSFADAFAREGLSVWWDATLRSGEAYDEVTEAALRGAKAVVVLWSPRSVVSRWVRAEATIADRNRTLVPVTIEPCERPVMFELTQTADLAHWKGETRDPAWRAFLADVRRFVDAEPGPARSPSATAPAPRSPEPERRPSIAVLPFINRSGLSEDDVFADGMVEDLTVALSVSRQMKVIASSATAGYRTGSRNVRHIGRDLGVRYLLEGNVRRVGSDLRVSAQLVEAEDGDILWTQKFDRPLAELAALQEELVTEVARHLGVEVRRAEMEHALRKPGDITAWEAVLRAEAHLGRITRSGAEAAVLEARRAIAIEPDYAAAYGTLAIALGMLRSFRGGEDAELTREIRETVDRARAFESSDPVVLARIATGLIFVGKVQEGLPFAERAVAINPNLELPRLALGHVLQRLGRMDDAIAEFAAAERLAPNGIWAHAPALWRSVTHFEAGRFDQALEAVEQALGIAPSPMSQLQLMICLASLGRWERALEAMRRWRDTSPDASAQAAEGIVRNNLYPGRAGQRIDELAAIVRRLWEETGG